MQVLLVVVAVIIILFVLSLVVFWFTIPFSVYLIAIGLPAGVVLTLMRSFEVLVGAGNPEMAPPDAQYTEGEPAKGQRPRDYAWPHYFAGQVLRDLAAIVLRVMLDLKWLWVRSWRLVPQWNLAAALVARGSRAWAVAIAWPVLIVVAAGIAGVSAGAVAGLIVLSTLVGAFSLCAWVVGSAATWALRGFEWVWRATRKTTAHCPRCFRRVEVPIFRCPGPHADGSRQALHRYLRPGVHGIFWRLCGCGAELPASVSRAVWRLPASCPHCDSPLYRGASMIPEARLALFGAPDSGKTWLVEQGLKPVQGQDDRIVGGGGSGKWGVTLLRRQMGAGAAVVQVLETSAVSQRADEAYDYLQSATGMLFVLSGPDVLREGVLGPEAESAYQAVIGLLRFRGVNTRDKCLAVVITRADQVADAPDSSRAAEWLTQQGCGNLVRRIHRDFRRVGFFVCDPRADTAATVWQWTLGAVGFRLFDLTGRSADALAR